jgi:hypothetical protein
MEHRAMTETAVAVRRQSTSAGTLNVVTAAPAHVEQ